MQLSTGLGDEIRRELGEHVLMAPAHVAKILDVPESTLSLWRSQGGGPQYVKIGKRVSYLEADIIAFVEKRRCEGGNGAANGKAA
jgi:hypothetical protein